MIISRKMTNRRRLSLVTESGSLLLIAMCFLVHESAGLRFTSVQIPSLIQRSSNFFMGCLYQLDQPLGQQLYTVKWYRNNEEFYRLQYPLVIASNNNNNNNDNNNEQQPDSRPQQQYFAQAGVNVRMSSSNATHVHMLNASLDTEATYACEISTQDLSTIRYQKEIRVYVLPQTRLAVSGLKQRYSMGEQLSLVCSSDFSRPAAALGWFVNDHYIPKSNNWIQLGPRREISSGAASSNGTGEQPIGVEQERAAPSRQSLAIRVRLSADLLAWAARLNGTSDRQTADTREAAAVSSGSNSKQPFVAYNSLANSSHNNNNKPYQLQAALIRLQCKYRLAEVSDVSFNELSLSPRSFSEMHSAQSAGDHLRIMESELRRRKSDLSSPPSSSSFDSGQRLAHHQTEPEAEGNKEKRDDADHGQAAADQFGARQRRPAPIDPLSSGSSLPLGPEAARHRKARLAQRINKSRYNQNQLSQSDSQERAAARFLEGSTHRSTNLSMATIHKSNLENQILQMNPATLAHEGQLRAHFRRLAAGDQLGAGGKTFAAAHSSRGGSSYSQDACRAGALALQPDDPLLVWPSSGEDTPTDESAKEEAGRRKRRATRSTLLEEESKTRLTEARQLEVKRRRVVDGWAAEWDPPSTATPGRHTSDGRPARRRRETGAADNEAQVMSVKCMTIAALIGAAPDPHPDRGATTTVSMARPQGTHSPPQAHSLQSQSQSQSALIAGESNPGARFCNNRPNHDRDSRVQWPPSLSGSNWDIINEQANNAYHHQLNHPASSHASPNSQQQTRIAYLNATSSQLGHSLLNQTQLSTRLSHAGPASAPLEEAAGPLLAPPLLEWFINNQEAPRDSVDYWPQLPLLERTPSSEGVGPSNHDDPSSGSIINYPDQESQWDARNSVHNQLYSSHHHSPDGDSIQGQQPNEHKTGAAIDYAQYFANFDSKPIEQSLNLKIPVRKRDFLTPDSKLRIRCSSTQAQILMSDAIEIKILLLSEDSNQHQLINNNDQQHKSGLSSWQRRQRVSNNNRFNQQQQHPMVPSMAKIKNHAKSLQQQQLQKSNSTNARVIWTYDNLISLSIICVLMLINLANNLYYII